MGHNWSRSLETVQVTFSSHEDSVSHSADRDCGYSAILRQALRQVWSSYFIGRVRANKRCALGAVDCNDLVRSFVHVSNYA